MLINRARLIFISFILIAVAALPVGGMAQEGGASGRIALPRGADVLLVDAGSGQELLLTLEGDALISSVAWAPARDRLAVSRSSRPPGDTAFGQDIEVVSAADGAVLSTIRRDKSGIILDAPIWSRDGAALLFDRQETVRFGVEFRIERARPDGTERGVLLENARSPALAPDGSRLAFVRAEGGEVLFVGGPEGQDARPVVPSGRFLLIAYPRFSPDGQWLLFATVTDPMRAPADEPDRPGALRALSFVQPIAAAPRRHGIPWDIWVVRPDGTDLKSLRTAEDDPSLAWSPNGTSIAVYGGRGLGIMPAMGGEVLPLRDEIIGFGGIDWAP